MEQVEDTAGDIVSMKKGTFKYLCVNVLLRIVMIKFVNFVNNLFVFFILFIYFLYIFIAVYYFCFYICIHKDATQVVKLFLKINKISSTLNLDSLTWRVLLIHVNNFS